MRAETELADSRQQRMRLSQQLIEAQEAERRHIARELHDELGQVLSTIRLKLRTVSRQTGAPAQEAIEACSSAVDRALTQVRALSLNLRPSVLDDFGLHAALEWYVGGQTAGAQLVGHFKSNLGDRRLPAPLETACFRVVQEAVTNVIRHAGARAFWVEVQHTGAQLSLRIRDDGAGFDAQAARDNASRGRSIGLLGMQERVELLGGQFQLESRRGSGTEIQARFALATSPQGGSDEEDLRVTRG
jgi:signal transduction histidine kinase